MQPVIDCIHELFVGVEALGSQPDLHVGEEMVIAWCQVRTVGGLSKISQLKSLIKTFVRAAVWGRALCRTTTPLVSITRRFFGSTSEVYSAFHNKPLTLLWSLAP